MLKNLILLALVASLSTACKKDPIVPANTGGGTLTNNNPNNGTGNGVAAASARVDGSNITFTQFTAQVNQADMVITVGNGPHQIQFILYDTKPGVYPVGNNGNHSCAYIFQSSIPYFTGYSGVETEVILTEVDLDKKEITGTFEFTACESPNGSCKQILKGVLNNIPIN